MNQIDYHFCKTQQSIYERAAHAGYDMQIFSDAYLSSTFCAEAMDTIYSRFQTNFAKECEDFFMPEISNKLIKYSNGDYFDLDVAAWIGFTYRQLFIETSIPSTELCRIVSFESMCRYYAGLHTISEKQAGEIIREDFNLPEQRYDSVLETS